jgi:hypothetical protein
MISGLDIAGFSKANIFGITIIVFIFLRKSNIISIGILIASTRGYLSIYIVYTKGKFDLFYIFMSVLRGYNKKEKKP